MDVNRNGFTPPLATANPNHDPLFQATQSETIIFSEQRYGNVVYFEQQRDYHIYLQQIENALAVITRKAGYIQGAENYKKYFMTRLAEPQCLPEAVRVRCYTLLTKIMHFFAQEPIQDINPAGMAILPHIITSLDRPIATIVQRMLLFYINFMGEMPNGVHVLLFQAKQALTQSYLLRWLETRYGNIGAGMLTAFKRQLQGTGWDVTDDYAVDHSSAEILKEAAAITDALIEYLTQHITINRMITHVGRVIYNDINRYISSLKNDRDKLFMLLFKDKALKSHLTEKYPDFRMGELLYPGKSYGRYVLKRPTAISIHVAKKLSSDPHTGKIYIIRSGSENENIKIHHLGDFFWVENKRTGVSIPLTLDALYLGKVAMALPDRELTAAIKHTPVHRLVDHLNPAWFSDHSRVLDDIHNQRILQAALVLIEKGLLNINRPFSQGRTALMTAILNRHINIARQLIEFDDNNVNIQDHDGNSALHFAVEVNSAEIVDWLLARQCNINLVNNQKITPLHMAVHIRNQSIVKQLLSQPPIDINCRDNAGNTPLILAVLSGDVDIAADLLTHGHIDINQPDGKGWTPLHIAAYNGNGDILALLSQNEAVAINRLLAGLHHTAVMLAIRRGQELAALHLIKHPDIDLNKRDFYGNSPLMLAAANANARIFNAVLHQGSADINLQNNYKESALSIAVSHWRQAYVQALLRQKDIDINISNPQGNTPLHIAAAAGDRYSVQALLNHSHIRADEKNHKGYSALILAAINGHAEVIDVFQKNGKADVNLTDNEEKTPLMHAVIRGSEAAIIALLKFDRINVGYNTSRSKSASSLATFFNFGAIGKRLADYSTRGTKGPGTPTRRV